MILCAREGSGSGCQKDHPATVGLCHSPKIWALVADVTASVIKRDNGSSGEICDRGASTECLVELVDKTCKGVSRWAFRMVEWGDENSAHTIMGWMGEKPRCCNVSDKALMHVALADPAQLRV